MKKIFIGLVFMFSLGSALRGDAKNSSMTSREVFSTLSQALLSIPSDIQSYDIQSYDIQPNHVRSKHKKKKKKFFKKLFKELLITTLNLAIEVVTGGKKRSPHTNIDGMTLQLRQNLCKLLEVEGRTCDLHPDQKNVSVPQLFNELFAYYSDKLDEFHEYFKQQVTKDFRSDFEKGVFCKESPESEPYLQAVVAAVDRLQPAGGFNPPSDSRASLPAIWCMLKIIADVGELVLCRKKNKKSSSPEFIEKVVVLIKDLRDFLSHDKILDSFEKLSKFIAKIKNAHSEGELKDIARDILKTCEKGIVFFDELFSSLKIYLRGKLDDIFSNIFYELSNANQPDPADFDIILRDPTFDAQHRNV